MRLTIIPIDGTVIIEGRAYTGIDLSSIDSNIHAIQWYDTFGIVEYKDASQPERIEDISPYLYLIDLCKSKEIEIKKENKPTDYHTWDEKKQDWKEDPILLKKTRKPTDYHIWDNKIKDWKEDPILKTKIEIENRIRGSKTYLASTDYYIIRKAETNEEIPESVLSKRLECREFIRANS